MDQLRQDSASYSHLREDADFSIFFERELEFRKARSYDIVRAPLKAMELIPVSMEAGPGAETIAYEQYDKTGVAKIIANYADDLPRADIKGKEFRFPVRSIGNSYGYSIQEIRAAALAGKPLQQRKADAAVRAQREEWNRLAFYGDAPSGLPGWLGNAAIPIATVANDGTGSTTTFSTKTPDQILRDMNNLCNGIVSLTNGAEQPDTLVMPIAQYAYISSTARSANSDTTILDYFLRNNPFIKSVDWANELKGAGAFLSTPQSTKDIMIAYRKSPDAFTFEMPQPFEQFPVQEEGLEFVIPCHSRVGGCLVYYPFSQSIAYGI
jgi:hypothetical protein